MKLLNLIARELDIPFKINFKHALADRSITETIIVIADSLSGNTGYGECCPRSYVTGETVQSVFEFIKKYKIVILDISSLQDLESFIIQYKEQIDLNPAAWCAIETALLDLLGKENKKTIEELLALPNLKGQFHYSAVIGDWDDDTTEKYIKRYLNMHFDYFKIKLSGELERDLFKLDLFKIQELTHIKIRIDANKMWTESVEAYEYLKQLCCQFTAVEEPLNRYSYENLAELSDKLETKIILDESFFKIEDFHKLQHDVGRFIINLRISKIGGILRSLKIAEKADNEGFGLVLGAQVGETSILSRAALTVASKYHKNIVAHEGAFGDYLLERDICSPPVKFGSGGIVETSILSESGIYGLGLSVLL